jgi:glycine dehydrogenase subunit 2
LIELAGTNAQAMKDAPVTMPVRRLDDVKAAKELDIAWHHKHLHARDTALPAGV